MQVKQITSTQHPLIKRLVKLRQDKKFRESEESVLITGKTIIQEIASHTALKALFYTEDKEDVAFQIQDKGCERIFVTSDIMKKISGLQSPEGIAAEVAIPAMNPLKNKKYIVALDGISDPGNAGTLIRSALALGWEGVFLLPQCVDPFNDKAIRSAKGATFHIPLYCGSYEDLQTLVEENKLQVFLADLSGKPLQKIQTKKPVLLILGNESHGISQVLKKQGTSVSIPIDASMESLNVASAGAILMYHMKHCCLQMD